MGTSNRQAVEQNNIDPEVRFDFNMPRNAAKVIDYVISEEATDPDTGDIVVEAVDLTDNTFAFGVKTSYEASAMAFTPTVDLANSDLPNGRVRVVYDATAARNLGLGVADCVHDGLRVDADGVPHQITAGLDQAFGRQ